MFTKDLEGKTIRIKDTVGAIWVTKFKEYEVVKVMSSTKVMLKNIDTAWSSNSRDNWEIVEKKQEKLNTGDKVILIKNTTSLRKGQLTEIREVNGERIIVDGILPGGWIKPDCIVKAIDVNKTRLKEAIELANEFGYKFIELFDIPNNYIDALGKNLSEFEVRQELDSLIIRDKQKLRGPWLVSSKMYTEELYEPLDIYIRGNCVNIMSSSINCNDKYVEEYKSISNMPLSKTRSFDPKNSSHVFGICSSFNEAGYIRLTAKGFNKLALISGATEIRKIKDKENEQNQVPIPF